MAQNRREFIALSAKCMACAAAGSAAFALEGCGQLDAPTLANDVTLRLQDYPILSTEGGVVTLNGSVTGYPHPIYVRNEGGGMYSALAGFCDHEGCSVNLSSNGFMCPCHGATFASDGRRLSGPARNGLPQFDTMVDPSTLTILKG